MNKMQRTLHENKICSIVGNELEKNYKGWQWYVECRLETGLVSVRNLDLNGDYGFYISIDKCADDGVIMRAGGEILERYNMDCTFKKYDATNLDFTGAAIGDTYATN
jgi:hypothetical protein